ncbi:MAG: sugar phosphate nucleotidyltransferase, partial [Egibacteraceae bacterium]
MLGVVLAAGGGTRLRPLTDDLPKTLLPVKDDCSILELALANLRTVDITDVVIVTGHAAEAIAARADELERTYGVRLRRVFNERYADWN